MTANVQEKDYVIQHLFNTYTREDGFQYNPNNSDRPVYRFFNTATQSHFYTDDEAEKDMIISSFPDYQYEGIAFQA